MLNANWLGASRLCTSRTIGAQGIKTWRVFGAPSHFLFKNKKISTTRDLKKHKGANLFINTRISITTEQGSTRNQFT